MSSILHLPRAVYLGLLGSTATTASFAPDDGDGDGAAGRVLPRGTDGYQEVLARQKLGACIAAEVEAAAA